MSIKDGKERMFEGYSSDETFALIVSGIISLCSWGAWYYGVFSVGQKVRSRGYRWMGAVPVFCALLLLVVLKLWAAEGVRHERAYILFYLAVGAAWVGIFRLHLPLFGLSPRDDVFERGNGAVAWATAGALVGGTCCFAGGNVGDGPGWWVVLFSGLLSTAALLALWLILHASTGVMEKLSIERDPAAGVRVAGFFLGAGLILGRAVAGNWVSAAETLSDFARMAWPALVLTAVAVVLERCSRPNLAGDRYSSCTASWAPGLVYGVGGLVMLFAW